IAAAFLALSALSVLSIELPAKASRHAALVEPRAASPAKDKLVPPPSEEPYFPMRADGQEFMLNVDSTVNMTDALNGFYYDPKWRGEKWVPFDQIEAIERGTRLMSTWKEYDEFSELRRFNRWHKFWERSSGFGP